MVKKRNKQSKRRNDYDVLSALDLMLSGNHSTVIGSDFILQNKDNSDIGYLDPGDLHNYDQFFVSALIDMIPNVKLLIPSNLEEIAKEYVNQRILLSAFHNKADSLIIDYDIAAAKELGNYEPYDNTVVIRAEPELNIFYDYIALYRLINNKRAIIDWQQKNTEAVNKNNKKVFDALKESSFAVVKIDRNLDYGAIKATNIITQREVLIIDKALNASRLEDKFFICTLLDMGTYYMTNGGGIPIDPISPGGKSVLTLLKKHILNLRNAKSINKDIIECVREIYGFCLRAGTLNGMTVREVIA